MTGWQGKLLRINLGSGLIETELLAEDLLESYPGGCALARKLAQLENISTENNKIIIAAGALNGTGAPAAAFCGIAGYVDDVVCVSLPLHFGAEIKFCGYDVLIIEGKADGWSYILIDEDVKILPIEELADLNPLEIESIIRSAFDQWRASETKIISIGDAEKFSPLLGLVTDGFVVNYTAKLASVFAEKHLKAIALRGIFDLKLARPSEFNQLITEAIKDFRDKQKNFEEKFYNIFQKVNIPLFSRIYANEAEKIACFGCPIACLRKKKEKFLPDFIAIYCLNRMMGINSIQEALSLYDFCTQEGIDPVALGLSARILIELGRSGKFETPPLRAGDKKHILHLLKDKDSLLHKKANLLAKEYEMESEFKELEDSLKRIEKIIFSDIDGYDNKIKVIDALGFCPYILYLFPYELLIEMYQAATGKLLKE